METNAKFEVVEELYQGSRSIIYSGKCVEDGTPVIIKALRRESLTEENIGVFRKEFEIIKEFTDFPGIVQTFGIETFESTLAIVLEDIGGKSLRSQLAERAFSLEETLQIGVHVAAALEQIHANQLMHKDLNPNNIVYNRETGTVKIIDFGIASRVSRENPSLEIHHLLGTLPYISPEQTGRMNRLVDYRTDLYSFGATLYEMLTGGPPFQGDDPLEIIHGHIALPPTRVDVIDRDIPAQIGDVVEKLLKKNAEERYQSAKGVKADLQNCLEQLSGNGLVNRFPLGQKDVSSRLILGQKLYGRDEEVGQLLLGFEQVLAGNSQLFLISGSSGIGKTVLVSEVHKPITESRGYFISSKFDQFDRNTPYMAIVNAFNGLARQLLAEDDDQLRQWRKNLTETLGENGGIVTGTIPEMSLIMGPQAPVDELPPLETKNRFNVVFQKFLGVLATVEHPIVLFLDDLQWADIASLELMEQLLSSTEQRALYIIGSYRENEVDENHPLTLLTNELRKGEVPLTEISLGPLSRKDVSALISDTLFLAAEEIEELAEHVYAKTYGNPFFVGQLLETFYAEDLLYFDFEGLKWRWKLEQIREYGFSDNVIDLLVNKIGKLTPHCQRILKQASCIGTVFDRRLLAALEGGNDDLTIRACDEATTAGMIQKVTKGSPLLSDEKERGSKEGEIVYKFVHDRVLQALYTNIPLKVRLEIHERIGQIILERAAKRGAELDLFQVVLHLNLARSLISKPEEKQRLASLNLKAAKKAKLSAANKSALEYSEAGIALLLEDSWQKEYQLSLALHEEAAEASYLTTNPDKVTAYTNIVFKNAKHILDRVKTAEVKICALSSEDKNVDVLRFGVDFLAKLGLRIPLVPSKLSLLTALIRAKLSFGRKSDEDYLALPQMTDEKMLATMRILSALSLSAYTSNRNLYAYLIFTQVRLIVTYGHSQFSSSTMCSYGLILCAKLGDMEGGYRCGRLTLKLLEMYFDRSRVSRVKAISHGFIFPWKDHLFGTGLELQKIYRQGIDAGDFQYASLSVSLYHNHMLFCGGVELKKLTEEMRTYIRAFDRMKIVMWRNFVVTHLQVGINLAEEVPDPLLLDTEECTEVARIAQLRKDEDEMGEWVVHAGKTILHVFFGEFVRGMISARESRRLNHASSGTPPSAFVMMCEAIIYLRGTADWQSAEGRENRRLLKVIEKNLTGRAAHAPVNYLHMVHLFRAEKHRFMGQDVLAAEHYDQAIEQAALNNYVNAEALANELAADFYFSRGKKTIARAYAENARLAYLRWGARAKVAHLEDRYSGLLAKIGSRPRGTVHRSTSEKTTAHLHSLDFNSVMKAAQGISQEIVLDKLKEALIRTVAENAGAEKGVLIMPDKGQLHIEAGCLYDNGQFVPIGTGMLRNSEEVSQSIVRVVARSREPVVLGNASRIGDFTGDAYVRKFQPRSVLCMPIVRSKNLAGILYLENNRAEDVFTKERLDILHVLSSQAAISIRNAKLYQELSSSKTILQHALEKAEESDRIKTNFLARTSHELLTPLNPIINIPEWIVEGFVNKTGVYCNSCQTGFELEQDEKIEEIECCPVCGESGTLVEKQMVVYERSMEEIVPNMQKVIESGNRLLNIVNDILSFSNLQVSDASLKLSEVNLDLLLRDVRLHLETLGTKHDVTIRTSNGSPEPTALLDDERMKQVLVILGKNAIQFSPRDSEILIRVEREKEDLIFSVEDHGPGIAPADLEIIFESFRQVDEGKTREQGGAGLGLAIAKNIVEMHGGQIWVESELDRGSVFFVRLPLTASTDR